MLFLSHFGEVPAKQIYFLNSIDGTNNHVSEAHKNSASRVCNQERLHAVTEELKPTFCFLILYLQGHWRVHPLAARTA